MYPLHPKHRCLRHSPVSAGPVHKTNGILTEERNAEERSFPSLMSNEVNRDTEISSEIEEIVSLENEGESETAAALRIFVLMASPNYDLATMADTSATVFFELLFQLVSPLGLLANLASLISLADRWRMRGIVVAKSSTISDAPWVLGLNAVSLASGIFGNIILLMHAELWFPRRISMLITGICYMVSVCIYMGLLGAVEHEYFGANSGDVHRTLGYWQAVCASVLYFTACIVLGAHMYYFRHRKWDILLSHRQRQLMILCIIYMGWIAIGAAAFQARTMLDVNYAEATYFVVVSYLTLGYGDIVPQNNLGRALIIPFIYLGIVIGGLVSIAIFQANVNSAHSKSVIAEIQRNMRLLQQQWEEDNKSFQASVKGDSSKTSNEIKQSMESEQVHTEEEGFNEIRRIVASSRRKQLLWQLGLTLIWLFLFWLIGALIFSHTEGWEYFHAFYMCGISLSSVGYGDYVPKTAGGRSVFIHWSIVALPTMSAVVSGISAVFMAFFSDNSIMKYLENQLKRKGKEHTDKNPRHVHIKSWFEQKRVLELLPPSITPEIYNKISQGNDNTQFEFDVWHNVVSALYGDIPLPANYWISDSSPLNIPGLNEKHVLMLILIHLFKDDPLEKRFRSLQ